eukprot:1154915-Pelagomonas_calceolata.AAC.1
MTRISRISSQWIVDAVAHSNKQIMLLGTRLNFVCWTDALICRGTAGFLLQGLGELTHTWATLLGA